MNRYQKSFCSEKISGYFLPSRNENSELAFNRAKSEAIAAYNASLKLLYNYSFNEFSAGIKATNND